MFGQKLPTNSVEVYKSLLNREVFICVYFAPGFQFTVKTLKTETPSDRHLFKADTFQCPNGEFLLKVTFTKRTPLRRTILLAEKGVHLKCIKGVVMKRGVSFLCQK